MTMRYCSMAESKTGDGSLNFAKVTLGWLALCLPAIGLANEVCAEIPDGVSVRPYVIEDVEFRAPGAFRIIYAVSDGTVLWVRFDSPKPWPRPYPAGPTGEDFLLDWYESKDCLTVTKHGHYLNGGQELLSTFPTELFLAQGGYVTHWGQSPMSLQRQIGQ